MILFSRCITNRSVHLAVFFFFQAEDGIRDLTVTGVQTCALPISSSRGTGSRVGPSPRKRLVEPARDHRGDLPVVLLQHHDVAVSADTQIGEPEEDRKSVV